MQRPGCLLSFFIFIIYFWLCWVFIAGRGLSLVVVRGATLHCGAWASPCGGFSCCRALVLGARAAVIAAQAYLPRGMWDLPGPGIEPVSPVL